MFSGYEPFIPVLHLYYIVLYVLFFVSNVFQFFLRVCVCIICVFMLAL